jgi:branched-chain amino acid transport system substrate-binding protein
MKTGRQCYRLDLKRWNLFEALIFRIPVSIHFGLVGKFNALWPRRTAAKTKNRPFFDSAMPLPQIARAEAQRARRPITGMISKLSAAGHRSLLSYASSILPPVLLLGLAIAGCSTSLPGMFGTSSTPIATQPGSQEGQAPIESQALPAGQGAIRVGLILPLGAGGNAATAAQSMKNAADLALAEFGTTNIQLIVKDDRGTAQGAQAAVKAAIQEGAEIILGPLFSSAVAAAGQIARTRNVPIIAFSTDTNVATSGVYLLSFLPENDVDRIVSYSASAGKRSIVAMLPENAYGSVVEAQLQQIAGQRGARVIAIQRYSQDKGKMGEAVRRVAAAVGQADVILIADAAESTPSIVQALAQGGVALGRVQLIGTGLWDDPSLLGDPKLNGAWYAAPDDAGYRAFTQRYKARFGSEPVRTASLAYDAVSLVAALVKTQGPDRFSQASLTNPSGFTGIDGVFRFRQDGTSERGLAVMEIRNGTTRVVSPAPRAFSTAAAQN